MRESFNKVRAKAPLRLGLAGGGTDVAPYSDAFGGMVLNATVSLYAYCTVTPRSDGLVSLEALDIDKSFQCPAQPSLPLGHELALVAQAYNRIVSDFCNGQPFAVTIRTHADVPPGSGLGSSSTMVVAVVTALCEYLRVPLGEYETARLAFNIERQDLGLSGGKQDQYAATFGGFNLMEFYAADRVIINPLRLRPWIISELEAGLILYFSGRSRASAAIIEEQVHNVKTGQSRSIEAMHRLKDQARQMKEALLLGDFAGFGEVLRDGWTAKRDMAANISTAEIEQVLDAAIATGAHGGKISGAGGGGFVMISVPPERKPGVLKALGSFRGNLFNCHFTQEGAQAWTVL
ncbi:GHMP kinase [Xinfangfangia sp. CPCC 101601]|uniref:GHMP kinase n=1 Tax=Pseudogemmobacter lacusdianii TaxID=3069608 RepID=A0ABU0W0H5_9RHOB|nr:GHMP kinase [Xinfangfangia sp. CPCC 101601]MDQ2067258.1 GHMP kinase [Xinfangfangia sp. CPCC 101601]